MRLITILYNTLLYLSRAAPHNELTSFPTRRSSDLDRLGKNHFFKSFLTTWPRSITNWTFSSNVMSVRGSPVTAIRSEEHTSELQSRRDLVCRLLFEKKKNKRIFKNSLYSKCIRLYV